MRKATHLAAKTSSTSATTTLQPSWPKQLAHARPMPFAAPAPRRKLRALPHRQLKSTAQDYRSAFFADAACARRAGAPHARFALLAHQTALHTWHVSERTQPSVWWPSTARTPGQCPLRCLRPLAPVDRAQVLCRQSSLARTPGRLTRCQTPHTAGFLSPSQHSHSFGATATTQQKQHPTK